MEGHNRVSKRCASWPQCGRSASKFEEIRHNMMIHVIPPKIDTGVSGLDDILLGGLPAGQMYLLEGDPGTGKTTVGMQFIMAGTRHNEKSLYVTLSESRGELAGSAVSHGW